MKNSLYIGLNNARLERSLGSLLQLEFSDWNVMLSSEAVSDQQLKMCQGAIIWKNDPEPLLNMPDLKLIQCMGAGVDFIDWSLPQFKSVPVCRFVDESLSIQLAQYVIGHILSDKLEFDLYRDLQQRKRWQEHSPKKGNNVLILGLGVIGSQIANLLNQMDFQLFSWSTRVKGIDFIQEMTTRQELIKMIPDIDYLVNLLPSTEKTSDFINESLLNHMKSDACIINVGRGDTLNEQALLSCLDKKIIRKAILDVFKHEPLPSDHRFWTHPSILITPHVAAQSDLSAVVRVFSRNLNKVIHGDEPDYRVDPDRGY